MNRTRAWRLHQKERIKRKRRNYWDGRIGKYWETPAACSGPCCGNPRKWFGQRTVQERRADAR